MLISEGYRELNRQLHKDNPSFGADLSRWSHHALHLAKANNYGSVLDYGCGKGNLARTFLESNITVSEYDPAIDGKDGEPEPAEFVVCTDVLEHIEPPHINAVLRHLKRLTQKRLFVTIHTGAARKTLADGRNAHILQRAPSWWREKLRCYFQILLWEEREPVIAAELVAKPHSDYRSPIERRTITGPIAGFFQDIRRQINEASDDFSQIKDIRMFEGVGDEVADMQASCENLLTFDDIDAAMGDLARLARRAVFVGVDVDDLRTEYDWKRIFEKRLRLAKLDRVGPKILAMGSPLVGVQGVVAVGAMQCEDRWEQVKAAIERVPEQRIPLSGAHKRRALLICYGPSLGDTLEIIRREAAKPDTDIISVSGAHDFLLDHGIWPTFHIECDPRPHKALNLKAGTAVTSYLIASCVHQDFFDRINGCDVCLWHVSSTEHLYKLMEMGEDRRHIISGGGSVGLRAITLLYGMGYRNFDIFAMDCSYSSSGEKWAGKHAGKKEDAVECKCDERIFLTSPTLLTYVTGFFETMQKAPDLDVRLYGDGLLQATCLFYQEANRLPKQIKTDNAP